MKSILTAGALLLAAAAALAAEPLSKTELGAKVYNDLGPDSVDTSSYPKAQQDNYKIFAKKCSQCHTLARPLNSAIIDKEDWRRFVKRMHMRVAERSATAITPDEARAVIDFLAYDAKLRKVDKKAAFEAATASLKSRFKDVDARRKKEQADGDQKKARGYGDPTGASPQAQ